MLSAAQLQPVGSKAMVGRSVGKSCGCTRLGKCSKLRAVHPEQKDILMAIGRRDVDLLNASRGSLILRSLHIDLEKRPNCETSSGAHAALLIRSML